MRGNVIGGETLDKTGREKGTEDHLANRGRSERPGAVRSQTT